jgi:hypothetical protein
VLRLVVILESIVGGKDVGRDSEGVGRRAQRPEVGSQDHNGKVDILSIIVRLVHALLELSGQILAETHILNDAQIRHAPDNIAKKNLPVNILCSLFVYSKPQASLSFEIMLASDSSDAETPWMRRFESLVV